MGSEDLYVLMCDVCSQIPCVQMCCPHGEAFLNTDPANPIQRTCIKNKNRNTKYDATFHDHAGEPITSWKRDEHYRLVAPKEGKFECPVEKMSKGSKHIDGNFIFLGYLADPAVFKISMNGSLKGIMPDNEYDENYEIIEEKTLEVEYKPHEFCLVESEVESEDDSTKLDFQLFVCKKPEGIKDADADCDKLMIKVQSTSWIISIVFLIITLIIYLIEPSLKKQYQFSRITIAIIVNMIALFITSVHIHLMKDPDQLHLSEHQGKIGKSKNYCKISKLIDIFFLRMHSGGILQTIFLSGINSINFDKLGLESFFRDSFSGCMS